MIAETDIIYLHLHGDKETVRVHLGVHIAPGLKAHRVTCRKGCLIYPFLYQVLFVRHNQFLRLPLLPQFTGFWLKCAFRYANQAHQLTKITKTNS